MNPNVFYYVFLQVQLFHPLPKHTSLTIALYIALRESHKDLGIVMSHDLSWNKHYDYLLSKAYRTLGLLCRTFSNTMSIHAKKVLYISLVRSRLSYCSPIWRPRLLKDIKSIENVQRRATNYILQDYKSCYINKTSHAIYL